MITAYRLQQNRLQIDQLGLNNALPGDTVWLDVVEPTDEERSWLDSYYVEEVPDSEDLNEIEATSRFYQDKDGLHITSFFPHRSGKEVRNTSVSFNLRPHLLITLRDEEVGLFRLVRNYLKRQHFDLDSPMIVLTALFTAKVDYLADLLEEVYESLELVSEITLREDTNDETRDQALKEIGQQEDLNGKIRLSLLDSQRSLRYLVRNRRIRLADHHQQEIMEMLRDIDSLLPHTAFLFDKINFLQEAVMGFINLEQNKIIKTFSVVATVFMPPTLIASSYGMNFSIMPELGWEMGYPFAVSFMILSGLGTYYAFKKKGLL
ncbi:magnesium/cobalt transporter CorA [Sansalvadorimonas sp. 2012CJ34-2]|uniref:Magnesium transport protein CorA n=1 Tax=Parendozoicomonas callyspongiae TaxID=2942213 RepID=A0ABT0PGK9_9GAMM|nr:magnesium/cobalt transporter CorA [Sansalvadorimonas sp. 2012CJ34-2]MCL6270522.1 magnesium/cobalt transporter CorA [Sansalvadorimonas sp. 2012CJ34-2]